MDYLSYGTGLYSLWNCSHVLISWYIVPYTHSEYATMCVYVSWWLTLLFLLHQKGETALDVAKRWDNHDVVTYLEEIGEYTY